MSYADLDPEFIKEMEEKIPEPPAIEYARRSAHANELAQRNLIALTTLEAETSQEVITAIEDLSQSLEEQSGPVVEKLEELRQVTEAAKDSTSNAEVARKIQDLAKETVASIKKIKIETKAPNVNVAPAAVHIPEVDLEPIREKLDEVKTDWLEAIAGLIAATPEPVDTTSTLEDIKNVMQEIRDRPIPVPTFPGTMKVTNPDGSNIAGGGGGGGGASAGDVAHDAVDTGNPVKIGGKANSSAPTPVSATGDRVDGWFDMFGRQAITDLDPELNNYTGMTSLRDKLVAQRYTVLPDSIADGFQSFWTFTNANGGTSTVSGGEGLIQTSASATGSAQITSTAPAYFPGQVSWFNSAVRFGDTGSAGNVRRIGVFTVSGTTPQDGFFYELNGTTFDAVVVKGGVEVSRTVSTSWSRVVAAPFTMSTSYISLELRWTANTAYFYVNNVLRHQYTGATSAITNTLNFPMTLQNINSSGATNRVMAVRNCGIGRFGTPEVQAAAEPIYKKLVDDSVSGTTYIGEAILNTATSAAGWRIKKIVETTGLTTITWSGTGFGAIWDNRATTVSYS